MKIRKDGSLETDIISLIGMACTGGVLVIWAKETFGNYLEVAEDVEEPEEEEETEQSWKKYVQPQESNGKYEIKI